MKNLVCITSVIHTPNIPLSYTNTRSVYTWSERFEQTKKTISTIREKIPDSKIFLVECSELTDTETNYFENNVDYLLNLYENETLRNKIYSKSKSLGEGIQTIKSIEYIIEKNIQFENYIKISGRYWITDNFIYKNIDNNKITVQIMDKENVVTFFYKIPQLILSEYLFFLKSLECFQYFVNCVGYEVLFKIFIDKMNVNKNIEILDVKPIGITGNISVDGVLLNFSK